MDTTPVKLPIHKHLLVPCPRFVFEHCLGCHVKGVIYGGYICSDPKCLAWFHKDCAEAPPEINHSLHPQHPLILTIYEKNFKCDLCGQEQHDFKVFIGYHCSICDFNLDLTCGTKLPSPAIENPMCHDHPLVFLKKREEDVPCEICKFSIDHRPSYTCLECDVYFHLGCIHFGKEVNHPCHPMHPLKFITYESLKDEDDKSCLLCGENLENYLIYRCSICNFNTCFHCTKYPPPLIVDHTKTHKHPLTLFSRKISFTCSHSGQICDARPYMCFQCNFVIKGNCIGLPSVINVNRHDHRVSFTQYLGPGYLKCGVCRKSISQFNGGYSCSICPSYAVHSQCAISSKVWDGAELEGIVEIIEDTTPFEVVGHNLIRHVSHAEHILQLHKDIIIHDQLTRCEACIHPIGFEPIYSCETCCFILHEKCANLPLKKRLIFDTVPFTLLLEENNIKVREVLDCEICGTFSTGFKYTSKLIKEESLDVDIHCGSLSEPFLHSSHLHPLYFDSKKDTSCDACEKHVDGHMFHCDECEFDLCFACATKPEKIRYNNHEHPVTLCCGEEASGQYWCDICEKELDSSKWFYTCDDCGVTIHVECLLGDFSRLLPGCIIDYHGYEYEVVLNSRNTRPFCSMCLSRCKFPIILKDLEDNKYICSRLCFKKLFVYSTRKIFEFLYV